VSVESLSDLFIVNVPVMFRIVKSGGTDIVKRNKEEYVGKMIAEYKHTRLP